MIRPHVFLRTSCVVGNDSGGYFANEYPNLATGMACGRYLAKLKA